MELFLLGITVPVFYIWGFIAFVRWLQRLASGKSQQIDSDTNTLEYLNTQLVKNPGIKLADALEGLPRAKLQEVTVSVPISESQDRGNTPIRTANQPIAPLSPAANRQSGELFANWYSENSINLLLYIGAFFIVAAASIFIGFQWGTIANSAKASMLTFVTIGFLLSGLLCATSPKVKSAGATFCAIATLLVPFNGLGWYTFVLKLAGVPFGSVWLTTTIVGILLSVVLSIYLKQKIYAYIASFGALSFVLSVVNLTQTREEYYVLGAQVSSFMLLLCWRLISHQENKLKDIYYPALELSSNIIMPLSLMFGALKALGNDTFTSTPTAVSVLFATLYYVVSYGFTQNVNMLVMSEMLLPLGMGILMSSYHVAYQNILLALAGISVYFVICSFLWKHLSLSEESRSNDYAALGLAGIVYVMHGFDAIPISITIFLAAIPCVESLIIGYSKRKSHFLPVAAIFFAIFLFHIHDEYIKPFITEGIFGLLLSVGSIAWLLLADSLKYNFRNVVKLSLVIGLNYAVFGMLFSSGTSLHFIYSVAITSIASGIYAYRFAHTGWWYVATTLTYWVVLLSLGHWRVAGQFYPLVISVWSYVLYGVSLTLPADDATAWRRISYAGILTGSLAALYPFRDLWIPGQNSKYVYLRTDLVSVYANICAYIAALFFFADAQLRRSSWRRYLASFLLVSAISWTLQRLNITETQMYTLLWGGYALVLAHIRRMKEDRQNTPLLDFFGITILLVPVTFQSLGIESLRYGMILGLYGMYLLGYGTMKNVQNYTYAGVAGLVLAVLTQTYRFILGLEKWVIIGSVGLAILALATGLMAKRNSQTH